MDTVGQRLLHRLATNNGNSESGYGSRERDSVTTNMAYNPGNGLLWLFLTLIGCFGIFFAFSEYFQIFSFFWYFWNFLIFMYLLICFVILNCAKGLLAIELGLRLALFEFLR